MPIGGRRLLAVLPGLLLTAMAVGVCLGVADLMGIPVMLLAMLSGLAAGGLRRAARLRPGLDVAAKPLLRVGVALLGAQISLLTIIALGPVTLALVITCLVLTLGVGYTLGRWLRLDRDIALLLAGATAICGASAALAIASVLPDSPKKIRWTGVTIITVTVLSTIAMVSYPTLLGFMPLSDIQAGFTIGASVHDVAQVVGAGYALSPEAGDAAVLVKLTRVFMLLPVVLALARFTRNANSTHPHYRLPHFLLGFIALVALNSLGAIPDGLGTVLRKVSQFLLIASVFAIGVVTPLGDIKSCGRTPVVAATLTTSFLLVLAVLLATLLPT